MPLAAVYFEHKIERDPVFSYGGQNISFWTQAAG